MVVACLTREVEKGGSKTRPASMPMRLGVIVCGAILAARAFAQTRPEPPVQAEKVVVAETLLSADAAGVTHVRFDDTAPADERTLASLGSRVANLQVNSGGAGSFGDEITLRGLPNTPYFSDPSVVLYFDDLPLGNAFSYPTGLFGFATAAIYRGPQGSAFGRGGEAGVIALSSAEPGATAGGELRVALGNYDARTGAFEVRSARGEHGDATVAGSYQERNGYVRNTQLGINVDDQQAYSGAARVRLRPNATSEFTLQLLASRHRDGAQPLVPLGGPPFAVARGREGSTDIDFGGAALKAAFETTVGRFTATTSHTEWTLSPYDNRLTLPPTLDSRLEQAQRIWNEELRLASGAKSELTWQVGAWFSDANTHGDANRGIPIPGGAIPIEVSNFTLNAHTAALFGEATLAPAAGWRLTLGGRLEEVTKHFDRGQHVPGPGEFTAAKTFDAFLPKATLAYSVSPETTLSATLAEGAKPGGWSAYTASAALAPFRAETLRSLEIGVDTRLARNLSVAARAFAYSIRDYQIERSFNASDYLVVNAPRARSFGGELEASWRPVDEFTVTATLGVTDVTLREFTDPFTQANNSGHRAPYAPAYDGHLGATYRAPTGWFAAAGVAATGKTFFDESENPLFASAAHTVVDARIGFERARWRISLYGNNVADETYSTLIVPGVRHYVPGAPRTYGVEAELKW